MLADEPAAFATLLSRFRLAAGLTQEELAERAGLSVRGIGALERGGRTRPRAYTVRRLAEALQIALADRARFEQAALAASGAAPADETLPEGSFLGAVPTRALVAREEECEHLRTILQTVTAGGGRLVLLHGELGVGKTRLAQDLMLEARGQGYLVTTGRCYANEQAIPYYPFLEALAELATGVPASIGPEVQGRWARLQQLVSGMPPEEAARAGSSVERQQVAGAVSDLLLLVAQSAPLALLLDDLHWADRPSLRLLQHLARTIRPARILLAGTLRDTRLGEEQPELARLLQDLARDGLVERLGLRRFSLEETTALVAATMGQTEVSEEFAGFVQRRTKGNPRLVDQLVRALGGRLELQGEIGAGAMGRVFRARDRTSGVMVAAKLVLARAEIDLDTLLRFQQEGAMLSTLSHPNIVKIYDTFAEQHASCIIMEMLDGRSLGQILREGPLSLPHAKWLALQVAEALAYAHAQRIVHLDVKPDNVMVLAGDQVKVTDFGIARILQPDTSLQTIATTGLRMGTPLYMAPEQVAGKRVDGRTDIYALGCVLYHMVTGRPPFEGGDALAVAVQQLQEEPLPPSRIAPAIPGDWDALILKAMAKDPARRFQSAHEMREALAALGEQMVARATTRRRDWRLAAFGAILVVATIVGGLWAHATRGSQRPGPAAGAPPLAQTPGDQFAAYLARARFNGYVYLERRGQVILSKGFGMADAEDKRPNTAQTRWPAFAATRFLVALAIMKLQEQGKLAVGQAICTASSGCPAAWRPLTVENLLLNTSGIASFDPFAPDVTLRGTMAACAAMPPVSAPGTESPATWSDCNTFLLGAIVEKVTGKTWEAAMHDLVFGPAGMTDTGRMTNALRPPRRGRLYRAGAPTQELNYEGYNLAYTTVDDLVRLGHALLAGTLISRQSLDAMFTLRFHDDPNDPASPWRGYEVTGWPATATTYKQVCAACVNGGGEDDVGTYAGFFMTIWVSPEADSLQIEVNNDTGYFNSGVDEIQFGAQVNEILYGK